MGNYQRLLTEENKMDDELYTDIALMMLVAFVNDLDKEQVKVLMDSIKDNEDKYGNGFFPGLVYACMVHMRVLLLGYCEILNMTEEQMIQYYAMNYNQNRDVYKEIPGVNVQKVSEYLEALEDKD
jgi:hypothetical protein